VFFVIEIELQFGEQLFGEAKGRFSSRLRFAQNEKIIGKTYQLEPLSLYLFVEFVEIKVSQNR
jgi:hypothetical protein